MKKHIFILMLIMFLPNIILAQPINVVAGEDYTFLEAQCIDNLYLRVFMDVETDYNITGNINCNFNNRTEPYDYWTCNCVDDDFYLDISIPQDKINRFNIGWQYNILDGSERTNNRIIHFVENENATYSIQQAQSLQSEQVQQIISFITTFLFVAPISIFLLIFIIYKTRKKLRGWLKLKDEEKLKLKDILKKIFSREDIKPKQIDNNKQEIKQEKKLSPEQRVEEEIQEIFDLVNK